MESATSMVVEAGLSSLFKGLLEKVALLLGVEKEAKKLSSTLSRIQFLLSDAEDRQIKEERVRQWLSDLKDAAYDAEDILDEIEFMVLQSKIKGEAPIRKLTQQVRDLFSQASSNLGLGSRIKKIRERLEEIESENNELHLKVIRRSAVAAWERPPSSPIVDESIVFGREADREKLVHLLLTADDDPSSSSAGGNGVQVVPICGMGGLGKTTLAQLVYKDERVKKHFEVRAWICVSQDFDLIRLTKAIAESVPGGSPNLTTFANMQVSIEEALKEKRFLLVLDDIWHENPGACDALLAPLMNGARGSRILVTTRSRVVSSNMGTVPTHFLQGLSDDECWSLFQRRAAFVEGNSDRHQKLVKIGKEIVKKCKGLPLAAKTLGGLLRSKENISQWKEILKSEIWDLPEERNEIVPALKLSYHHLPAHLKRCFAYLCLCRKGDYLKDNELVRMWMAHGFIQPEVSKEMEDIGMEYLADLVSRSLLDYAGDAVHPGYSDGKDKKYKMHDLTYDLAQSVSGAEILVTEHRASHENVENARHVSYWVTTKLYNFEHLYCSKSMRTLVLKDLGPTFIDNIPADLFLNLKHMRVLDLAYSSITELPESIGELIHLRYLNLSATKIKRLPKSTTRLYNLQTLLLDYCKVLVELPSDLTKLANLKHLSLKECSVSIPPGIGRLTSLKALKNFTVKKMSGYKINELKNMIHLGGSLCISKLENVGNVQEATEAALKKKPKVHRLELEWKSDGIGLRQEGIEGEVLGGLQPHTNLKELQIAGYCGGTFPRWLGDSSFSNIVQVKLYDCRCHHLPSFGQLPALESLYLSFLYGLEKVGCDFYGNCAVKVFPSLQQLTISCMPDLEEWSGVECDVGHVTKITISECSKLKEFALFPLTSERVTIESCERLATLSKVWAIRHLTLSKCDGRILSSLQCLTSISSLSISEFPNLISLPSGLLQPHIPLDKLKITDCAQLMSSSEEVGLQHLTSLRSLEIFWCPQVTSLGDESLPTSLRSLKILGCNSLNWSPTGLQNLTSLVELRLDGCSKIQSLSEELPTSLQSLSIGHFAELVSLSAVGLQHLTSLHSLQISRCPQLTSLGDEALPTSLRRLQISKCDNLNCLPIGLQNLTSLFELRLDGCPKIQSLPEELPTTLQSLSITMLAELVSLLGGLQHVTSLNSLKIDECPQLTSLGDEALPTSLGRLRISKCDNLNSLPTGLQNLTSLDELRLDGCPKIHSLPEEIPTTLQLLDISKCSLLEEKCKVGGEYWCKISHIPFIRINGVCISSGWKIAIEYPNMTNN